MTWSELPHSRITQVAVLMVVCGEEKTEQPITGQLQ